MAISNCDAVGQLLPLREVNLSTIRRTALKRSQIAHVFAMAILPFLRLQEILSFARAFPWLCRPRHIAQGLRCQPYPQATLQDLKRFKEVFGCDFSSYSGELKEERNEIGDATLEEISLRFPHLTHLDLEYQPIWEGLCFLSRFQKLESLCLDGISKAAIPTFAVFKELRSLKRLSLTSTCIGDKELLYLKDLTNLRELNLQGTSVSAKGLVHLRGLEKLNLGECERVHDLSFLSHLPALTSLDLSSLSLNRSTIAQVSQCSLLEELVLRGIRLTDEDLSALKPLSHLKYLNLGPWSPDDWDDGSARTEITDEGLAALAELHALEWLNLFMTPIGDPGVFHLKDLPRLRFLSLSFTRVTKESLSLLAGSVSLKRLHLRGTAMEPAEFSLLAHLPSLKAVDLGSRVNDATLQALSHCPRLEKIELGGKAITGKGLSYLADLPRLRSLELLNTNLTSADLCLLLRFPQLQRLTVNCIPIGDEELELFAKLPHLTSLSLYGETKITDRSLPALSILLKRGDVYIGKNCLSKAGAETFKRLQEEREASRGSTPCALGWQALCQWSEED